MRNVIEIHVPNKKNFKFGLWASYKPTPIPYENMLTYIPVSFLFSFKKGFGLGLKIGLVWVLGLGLGIVLGFGFGIGNIIGGADGAVEHTSLWRHA